MASVAAWIAFQQGRPEDALERSLEYEQGRGDVSAEGVWLHCLCWRTAALFQLGEWDEVTERIGPQVVRLLGPLLAEPPGFTMVGLTHLALIRSLRGESDLDADVLTAVESSGLVDSGTRGAGLARIALAQGRFRDVQTHLDQIGTSNARTVRPMLGAVRADLFAETADWQAVDDFVEAEMAYSRATETRLLPPYLHRLLGRRALAMSDLAVAEASLVTAIDGFSAIPMPWEVARTRVLFSDVLRACGDDAGSQEQLSIALPVFQRLRSLADLASVRDRIAPTEQG